MHAPLIVVVPDDFYPRTPGGVRQLYNHSDTAYQVKRGDKISQLVILPVLRPTPVQVDKIEGGERGDNGFGSTGR